MTWSSDVTSAAVDIRLPLYLVEFFYLDSDAWCCLWLPYYWQRERERESRGHLCGPSSLYTTQSSTTELNIDNLLSHNTHTISRIPSISWRQILILYFCVNQFFNISVSVVDLHLKKIHLKNYDSIQIVFKLSIWIFDVFIIVYY